MDANSKYTGFEKMMQDKLGNHEYPYDHNDWLNFEKKLPKGKSHFRISKNIVRYIIFPAAVIIPTALILYFTNVFNTKNTNDISTSHTSDLTSQNNHMNNNTSEGATNTTNSNDNLNPATTYNNSNTSSSDNNDKANDQSADKTSNKLNDDNSKSNSTNDNSKTNNSNSQTNNDKTLSGELITSDIAEGCAPLKVKFSPWISSGSISYLWDFGDGKKSNIAEPSHTYSKAGSYTVSLTMASSDGKTKKKIVYAQQINVKDVPQASFEYSIDSETDEYTFKDNSTDAFVWTWSFGDISSSNEKDPTHTYNQDGNYNVKLTVMNTAGCADTLIKKITVKLKELYYCPTGFTPNGDGLNDYFGPIGERMNADGYKMQIFDNSGIRVFETTDLNVLWDGKNYQTNSDAPQGMYFWKISMKDKNNNLKESTGYLTLMR